VRESLNPDADRHLDWVGTLLSAVGLGAPVFALIQQPTHGWPIVRELASDGAIGRIWTVSRPLVYRSLTTLLAAGLSKSPADRPADAAHAPPERRATGPGHLG